MAEHIFTRNIYLCEKYVFARENPPFNYYSTFARENARRFFPPPRPVSEIKFTDLGSRDYRDAITDGVKRFAKCRYMPSSSKR